MKEYDVTVIGGGPSGAVAARHAANVGARVLLVERGDGSGRPAHCTGLVSPRTLTTTGASPKSILREIKGGILHAPNGQELEIKSNTVKGLVLDRAQLDRELLGLASSTGVDIRYQACANFVAPGRVFLRSKAGKEEVKTGLIIGADGPMSTVARCFSLPKPTRILGASQAIVAMEPRLQNGVEIFFGQKLTPGFFTWAVPAEEGRIRVGLAAPLEPDIETRLNHLLRRRFPGEIIERIRGLIPIGTCRRTVADGALLVGDAAGQVKATSGGGIYTGSLCARIAGEIGGYAALTGKTDEKTLLEYERRWRNKLGDELEFGWLAHQALSSLSDHELDRILSFIDDAKIKRLIEKEGDIDYPSRLVKAFLSDHSLWKNLIPFVPLLGRQGHLLGQLVRLIVASPGHSK
jgi:geranylgeranyl reductase family protein